MFCWALPLFWGLNDWRLRSATNAKMLPEPEPRAVRQFLIVPSIRSRDIAGRERSRVRHREQALQPLNLSNRLVNVHSFDHRGRRQDGSNGAALIFPERFVLTQSIRQRPPATGTQNSFFRGVPLAW